MDSHTGLPQIDLTLDALMERELVPFRRAIVSGADMVMTAHIQYPKVEPGTCLSQKTGKPLQREEDNPRCYKKTGTAGLVVVVRILSCHNKNLLDTQIS